MRQDHHGDQPGGRPRPARQARPAGGHGPPGPRLARPRPALGRPSGAVRGVPARGHPGRGHRPGRGARRGPGARHHLPGGRGAPPGRHRRARVAPGFPPGPAGGGVRLHGDRLPAVPGAALVQRPARGRPGAGAGGAVGLLPGRPGAPERDHRAPGRALQDRHPGDDPAGDGGPAPALHPRDAARPARGLRRDRGPVQHPLHRAPEGGGPGRPARVRPRPQGDGRHGLRPPGPGADGRAGGQGDRHRLRRTQVPQRPHERAQGAGPVAVHVAAEVRGQAADEGPGRGGAPGGRRRLPRRPARG